MYYYCTTLITHSSLTRYIITYILNMNKYQVYCMNNEKLPSEGIGSCGSKQSISQLIFAYDWRCRSIIGTVGVPVDRYGLPEVRPLVVGQPHVHFHSVANVQVCSVCGLD
jgi:hypothetical protein